MSWVGPWWSNFSNKSYQYWKLRYNQYHQSRSIKKYVKFSCKTHKNCLVYSLRCNHYYLLKFRNNWQIMIFYFGCNFTQTYLRKKVVHIFKKNHNRVESNPNRIHAYTPKLNFKTPPKKTQTLNMLRQKQAWTLAKIGKFMFEVCFLPNSDSSTTTALLWYEPSSSPTKISNSKEFGSTLKYLQFRNFFLCLWTHKYV